MAGVFANSALQSLDEVEQRGRSDLALASDRLVSGLFGYRQFTVELTLDPRLHAPEDATDPMAAALLRAADISGALDFVLLDPDRRPLASASGSGAYLWRGQPFVTRALNGALGRGVGIDPRFGRRVFYYAAPVFAPGGGVDRVLVAILDLEAIEADFRGSRPAIFMSDDSGIIYFSNRSELVFRDRTLAADHGPVQTEDETIAPFVRHRIWDVMGHQIWRVSAGRYLPRLALHLDQDLSVIGMRAEALIGLRPVLIDAALQAGAAGAVLSLLGLVILAVARQRRVLARANAVLEDRVAERTRALVQANASLRAEVAERIEAEAALKRAQQDLVQAGKLSALGTMTAGISHELNQPLMAIQSFADNAVTFIDRDNPETAQRNMRKVSDLAGRMARIIRNFRAFARQEHEAVRPVDLRQVVTGAADLVAQRLDRHGVALRLDLPDGPLWVLGGEVRLQQVVVNLLSNAIDAMAGSDPRAVTIALRGGDLVVLTVRDTGPGIEDPDKMFEPFYSTREIGEAEGVGLGLSISYGLVQSFGGKIRGENAPDGGAIFTVELQPAPKEPAS